MTDTAPPPAPETVQAITVIDDQPGLRQAWLMLAEQIPSSSDDAYASILRTLYNADSPEQLNDPWAAEGLKNWIDRAVTIRGIKRLPSSFDQGLGFFLVMDCTDPTTGKDFIATTGSVAIVAQLAKAYTSGWLPLSVIPRKPARESLNGNVPLHLQVVGKLNTGTQ